MSFILRIIGESWDGFKKYLINTSWLLFENSLRIISGVFIGIWIARYLGPEKFGVLSYVIAFTALFSGINKLGLDSILVRELTINLKNKNYLLGTSFWLKIFGSIISLIIISIIIQFTDNDESTIFFIYIISFSVIFQGFEVIDFYYQSVVMAKISSICRVLQLSISSLIKLVLIMNEAGLQWFVYVIGFDLIFTSICFIISYKFYFNSSINFVKYFDFTIAKSLLKDSFPLILSSIVIVAYMRIDQIMIKEILGNSEVGIYSAGIKLSEGFNFIGVVVTASLFPALINSKINDKKKFFDRLKNLYGLLIWTSILIIFGITFFGEQLMLFLFGDAYLRSFSVLIIHIWCLPFVYIGLIFTKHLIAENLTKIIFYRTFFGMIINVILNLILIYKIGIIGAAVASFAAQFSANFLFDIFDVRLRKHFVIKVKSFFYPFYLIKNLIKINK